MEVTAVSDIIFREEKSLIHPLNTLFGLSYRGDGEQVISPSQG